MDNDIKAFDDAVKRITQAVAKIPGRAATVAVNFTKERFRAQNWLDESPQPWQKRKAVKKKGKRSRKPTRNETRAVLVKSGRLMRSWRKISANADRAVIGTDVPYAAVHNNGGKVQAVASVGTYTKKAHSRVRKGRKENVEAHTVKAHRRNINFTMPRRQFVGNSAELNREINKLITNDLNKAING